MTDELSTLCLACGLCCNGSLFAFVALEGDEAERITALGARVSRRRGRPVMSLPCGKLEGTCCSVYAQRPGGCRRFVCRLGEALKAKETTLERALERVRTAQRLVAELRRLFATPEDAAVLQHAMGELGSPTSRPSDEAIAAQREATAFLREHFVGR